VLSEMTDELLKTKPANPTPTMITVFNRIAMEAQIKRNMVRQFKNLQLNKEQEEEYAALSKERDELLLELA